MIGTLILAFLALFGLLARTTSPTINAQYAKLIADIGVLVAFYYGATGLACAWAFRKVMFAKTSFLFTGIILPFLAGAFCFWVGYQVVRQSGLTGSAPVLAAFALGIPLTFVARLRNDGVFFKQRPIAYQSIEATTS
jgi:hypothetical protein